MDEKKRIIEFDAAEEVPADGQIPIDSASKGTKKITPALLLKAITDLLGNEALETLAQTLTGAVNEVKGIADDAQDLAENISDEYSSSSAYAKGDYCIHNNTLYKCTTAIGSGGEAWNASHWSATKCDDELSQLKQSLTDLSTADSLLPTAITVNSSTTTNTGTLTKSIADYRLIILEIQPNGAVQKVFYPYIGNNIALQGNIIQSMSVYSMGNVTINNKDVTVQFNSCAGWNNFTLRQVYGFGKIN